MLTAVCLTILLFFRCSTAYVTNLRFYPYYHLAPPGGWMNDPNGFSFYRNEFHLFYQYNPDSSQGPGTAHWGHAKSKDLFHWENLPIAMYPDQDYDRNGVFSGSAIIRSDNNMYILYTGNVNHPGEDPDHNNRQALAYSLDGINFIKYPHNPVIPADDFQPNIRDPKVWKHRDKFYMVLGNSFDNGSRGRVLLYSSDNLVHWQNLSIIEESDGDLGYMWECPDFFELNGKWILLFSPQGIAAQGDKYRNLYQVGYFVGDFDYDSSLFTVTSDFQELDHGHDFYATQTMLDKSGRRIMVAWVDMWERDYPERDDGWTGHMSIPRVLYLSRDQKLLQKPVKEIMNIRAGILYFGKARASTEVKINNNAGEIKILTSRRKNLELSLNDGNGTFVHISYDYSLGRVTLERNGNDGIRRTKWRPKAYLQMQIFVDRSSVELFCGEGEVTFTSRFFPTSDVMFRSESSLEHLSVYRIKKTITFT